MCWRPGPGRSAVSAVRVAYVILVTTRKYHTARHFFKRASSTKNEPHRRHFFKPHQLRMSIPSRSKPRGRTQRQRLLERAPTIAPLTLIAPVERLFQFNIHGNNQQANDGEYFGDIFSAAASPNSSLFTFQNIGPQKSLPFIPLL